MRKREYNSNEGQDMKFALMIDNYGPFVKGNSYEVTDEGRDWVKCKRDGRPCYIPDNMTDPNPFDSLIQEKKYEK